MNLKKLQRLIVVKGKPSSGKTTILNAVCTRLKKAYSAIPLVDKIVNSKGDRHLVMNARGKRLTAVCTPGDDANWVVKSFDLAEKYGCEVLVCAVNEPVRTTTTPMAKIAFDEIVTNNVLHPISFATRKLRPKPSQGYVDVKTVSKIMKSI